MMSEYYVKSREKSDGSGQREFIVVGNGEIRGPFASEALDDEACVALNDELEQQNKPKPKPFSMGMWSWSVCGQIEKQ